METKETSTDLKSCPFCGNEPRVKKQGWYPKNGGKQQTYQVRCDHCEMTDKFWSMDTIKEATDLWNKRQVKP